MSLGSSITRDSWCNIEYTPRQLHCNSSIHHEKCGGQMSHNLGNSCNKQTGHLINRGVCHNGKCGLSRSSCWPRWRPCPTSQTCKDGFVSMSSLFYNLFDTCQLPVLWKNLDLWLKICKKKLSRTKNIFFFSAIFKPNVVLLQELNSRRRKN